MRIASSWCTGLIASALLLAAACGGSDDDTDRLPGLDGATPDARTSDAGVDGRLPDIDAAPPIDAAVDAAPIQPQQLTVCATGGDFATVGAAIAAATPGSTIRICPGSYHEQLVVAGTPLTLIGTGGAAATILDGGDVGTVLTVRATAGDGVVVEGVTIQHGRAAAEGGGVRCEDSALTLIDSVVDANQAVGGGGLYARGCTLAVRTTTFSHNHGGPRGGGLLLDASAGTVEDGHVVANDATQGGGVASVEGTVAILRNQIGGNHAALQGGGVYHESNGRLGNNRVVDNTSGWTGGGLQLVGHGPTVSSNTVTGNEAVNDGGGFYLHQSAAALLGNEVSDNTSGDDGGGIRVFESMAMLTDNLIERNHAADGGGGVRISHVPSVLVDNVVRDNVAGGTGGGLDLDNDASLVQGGTIAGNHAGGSGGGVFAWLAPWTGLRIEDVLITGNDAWQGGGLYVVDNFTPVALKRLRVIGNRAAKGGGMMIAATSFTLVGSLFADNVASERGGAIFAGAPSAWTEPVCPCPPTDPIGQIDFVVMTRNRAPHGAGVWTAFAGLAIGNSILFDNLGAAIEASAVDGAPAGGDQDPPPPIMVPDLTYSDVYPAAFAGMTDPSGTGGNLDLDPGFVDPLAGDFHLRPDSPCIDTGSPSLIDLDGSRADMGLFGGGL